MNSIYSRKKKMELAGMGHNFCATGGCLMQIMKNGQCCEAMRLPGWWCIPYIFVANPRG